MNFLRFLSVVLLAELLIQIDPAHAESHCEGLSSQALGVLDQITPLAPLSDQDDPDARCQVHQLFAQHHEIQRRMASESCVPAFLNPDPARWAAARDRELASAEEWCSADLTAEVPAPSAASAGNPSNQAPNGTNGDPTIDEGRIPASCVSVELDANFSENRRAFLVNNCASLVDIIDRDTGEVSYSLGPSEKGIAFPSWSAWFR